MLTKVLLQIYFLEGLINVIDSAEYGDKGRMMPIKSYGHMLPIIFYLNEWTTTLFTIVNNQVHTS
jgi:hypothetical protein